MAIQPLHPRLRNNNVHYPPLVSTSLPDGFEDGELELDLYTSVLGGYIGITAISRDEDSDAMPDTAYVCVDIFELYEILGNHIELLDNMGVLA